MDLRLWSASLLVYVLPGYLVLLGSGYAGRLDILERLAISLGISFTGVTVLSILTLELGRGLGWAIQLWGFCLAGLAGWAFLARRASLRKAPLPASTEDPRSLRWLPTVLLLVIVGLAWALYAVGSPIFDTEEIVIARRIAENSILHVDNLMHRLGAPTTYLYVPYQFSEAMVARLAGWDVVLVMLKLRFIFVILGLAILYSLARTLWNDHRVACLITLAAVGVIFIDPDAVATRIGILAPYPNRHGVAPGLFLPLSFLFALKAMDPKEGRFFGRWFLGVALSMAIVHAREGSHLLLWMVGLGMVLAADARGRQVLRRWGILLATVLIVLIVFKLRQGAVVLHAESLTASLRSQIVAVARQMAHKPAHLLMGDLPETIPSSVGNYPFDHFRLFFQRVTTPGRERDDLAPAARAFIPIGILLLPLLFFWRKAAWARLIGVSIGLPLAVMAIPALFLALGVLARTPDVGDLIAPLAFWCFLFWAVSLVFLSGGAQGLWRRAQARWRMLQSGWAAPVAWAGAFLIWMGLYRYAILGLSEKMLWRVWQSRLALAAALGAGFLGCWFLDRRWRVSERLRPVSNEPSRALGFGLAIVLGTVVATARDHHPAGLSVQKRLRNQRIVISHPEDPVPMLLKYLHSNFSEGVVRFLRTQVSPGRVFLSDPSTIDAIPFYSNQYIAHSGLPLSTDRDFYSRYPQGTPHPVYNHRPAPAYLSEALRFLKDFHVEYWIIPPAYQDSIVPIVSDFNQTHPVFETVYSKDQFVIYRVDLQALKKEEHL